MLYFLMLKLDVTPQNVWVSHPGSYFKSFIFKKRIYRYCNNNTKKKLQPINCTLSHIVIKHTKHRKWTQNNSSIQTLSMWKIKFHQIKSQTIKNKISKTWIPYNNYNSSYVSFTKQYLEKRLYSHKYNNNEIATLKGTLQHTQLQQHRNLKSR